LRSTSPTGLTDRIKKLPPKKRAIKFVGRITFAWLVFTSHLLRPWSIRAVGNLLGDAFYVLSRRYRNVTLNNLRAAFADEKSESELREIARGVFRHFTRGALEFFYLLSLDRSRIEGMIDIEGREHIDAALAQGRGCILLTAHYGNWELLARKLVVLGYKVSVIARDSDDPGMTGITTRIRESGGYCVFDRDQPIIGAFRKLKNNECLGILPDQNDAEGIFVDFFGRPTATAVGPAMLALKSGAKIVPVFARRVDGGHYMARCYPAIEYVPAGNEKQDIPALTALVNKAIEREIRLNPSQWLWLHDRWKLSPPLSSVNGKEAAQS